MSIVYRGQLKGEPRFDACVTLASIENVPWERIRDAALTTMLRRYIDERRQDVFGIYVGDAERGAVRSLGRAV